MLVAHVHQTWLSIHSLHLLYIKQTSSTCRRPQRTRRLTSITHPSTWEDPPSLARLPWMAAQERRLLLSRLLNPIGQGHRSQRRTHRPRELVQPHLRHQVATGLDRQLKFPSWPFPINQRLVHYLVVHGPIMCPVTMTGTPSRAVITLQSVLTAVTTSLAWAMSATLDLGPQGTMAKRPNAI